MEQGCVFNIQRFTVHDGPGIRTEVFLKGCPLSCPWCSNPEGQRACPEPGVYPSRCLGRSACGACERASGAPNAVSFDDAGSICAIGRERREDWEAAVRACPAEALKEWGGYVGVDEVMDVVERDRAFFDRSGGGVTLSGGEPLVQAAFAKALLARCRQAGIHTCLSSTLHAPWEVAQPVLRETDVLLADFKCADADKHERFTGVRNDTISANLIRAAREECDIVIRIPVIPGFNDAPADAEAAIAFLDAHLAGRIREVQLLEFMHLGEEKCRSLARAYPMKTRDFDRATLHAGVLAMRDELTAHGFSCTLGGAAGN